MKTEDSQKNKPQADLTWALVLFVACIIYALFFQEDTPLNTFMLSGVD